MNMRTGKTKALAKSAKSILLLLAMLVMGQAEAWADEFTISDGTTTNNYLPLYGLYADTQGTISEFIIPSSQLTAINGKTIEQMTFYLSSPATASFGAASFNVYLEEVTGSNYDDSSASQLTASKTLVYAGALDATGATMDVPFSTNYTYKGGNLLVAIEVGTKGTYQSASFYGTTTTSNAGRYKYGSSSSSGRAKFIPKTTFITPTVGPALVVKDGSSKLTSPYAYDFGLATAGTTKTFTLSNPGTAAVEGLAVSETGSFGATLSATSIAAGGEATLTITMPSTTGSSAITVSSTTEGIADFVINASGTVKDPDKIFIDFSETLPSTYDWIVESGWSISSGKASSGYTASNITSAKVMVAEGGENIIFKYQGNSSWYTAALTVYYATTGNSSDADWTAVEGGTLTPTYNVWQTANITIPAAAKYIALNGKYTDIDDFYGLSVPNEPKMVVTQPASLNYGAITENTAKTFTIANTGLATLEGINVTSNNAAFTVTGAPTSLEAGASQEVTITISAANVGNFSSDITISATGMDNVQFTVSGTVLPTGLSVIDFNDNTLPARWENSSTSSYSSGWTFSDGAAYTSYYTCTMTTPKIIVNDGDMFVIKAKLNGNYSSYYVTINGSSDNGETWTAYTKKLSTDVLNSTDYTAVLLSDIPSTVNKLQFVGYYAYIDEIQGINYAADLVVTDSESAVQTSGLTYDFKECAANASVTYNFANTGAGTINITNVAITGDGAAAYSTNWTESVAAPFALTITRTYDAARAGAGAQAAAVTVTTSEGAFVINVTGTDKAANAPELAVSTNAIDFGKQTADAVETVTVTNNGTGSMTVNIASDSEDFEVSAATLTEIGAGESKEFTVTFKYGTPYGVKNGNITITPTYNAEAAETITVTGKAKDPATWSEDFAGNTLPTGWEAGSNWSFADGVAKGAYDYSSTTYLTTPKLEVSAATDELTFDYKRSNAKIVIEKNKDNAGWESLVTLPSTGYSTDSEWQTYTITGLETGTYQFRFANDDYQLDNFDGFKLKAAAAHEAEVKAQTIPTTGNQYVEYTASVDVKVTGTNNEELTVKFFIGNTQYGSNVVKTVTSNATESFEVTFTPDAAVSGDAYFTIESTDIAAFESDKVAVSIAAATVLDETVGLPDGLATGTKPSVLVKYTAKNGWNTICMPFALTSDILTSIFGAGWKAYEFYGYADGALKFRTPSNYAAGYPYIIYVETAATHAEGVKLFDTNVAQTTAKADTYSDVSFQGRYAPVAAGEWAADWYGVTSSGKLQKGNTATSYMKGFRAYFTGIAASASLSLNFEDSTTGITTVVAGSQLTEDDNIYNLNGQKVNAPDKGLYIINGRKVVVK